MSLAGTLEASVTSTPTDGEPGTGSASHVVEFAVTVSNEGETPVELSFSDAAKAEFVVYEDGEERWRFTEGRMFAQLLSRDRLEPGSETTYRGSWEDPDAGTYTAIATLRTDDVDCQARSQFSVPA